MDYLHGTACLAAYITKRFFPNGEASSVGRDPKLNARLATVNHNFIATNVLMRGMVQQSNQKSAKIGKCLELIGKISSNEHLFGPNFPKGT